MNPWNPYRDLPSECLTEHRDLVLYDTFHHIQALLLFPPNCSCNEACLCDEWRKKIILSLSTSRYMRACREKKDPKLLSAMKFYLDIPDAHLFMELYEEAYPRWLIEKELQTREEGKPFKIVHRLVWCIFRLAATHKATIFQRPKASLREVIRVILGPGPVKKNENYLGGEKAHFDRFNEYKPICHFIAALGFVKQNQEASSLTTLDHIEAFLKTAHWVKKELLGIENPNARKETMFREDGFISLPTWVDSNDVVIPIEPFKERLEQIEAFIEKELKKSNPDHNPDK
jgi:hypothetical protein